MTQYDKKSITVLYDYGYEYKPTSIDFNISPQRTIAIAKKGNADYIIMNKGLLATYGTEIDNRNKKNENQLKTILNFNSKNAVSNMFQNIATNEDIVELGVCGVNFKLYISPEYNNIEEQNNLFTHIKKINKQKNQNIFLTGSVILAEKNYGTSTSTEDIIYGVRIAAELGFNYFVISDILDEEQLNKLLLDATIPIWIGIKNIESVEELFEKAALYRKIGINGLIVGKAFLARFDSPQVLSGLNKIFVHGKSVDSALREIQTE